MCSIIGYCELNRLKADKSFMKIGFDLMHHRGPDCEGVIQLDESIVLGHQRLSIIDLNKGANQPMETDQSVIVFNGEIYNYIELKKEFFSNINFSTNSDTEVLQKGLEKFGISFLNKVNGMFAFSYYNKSTKELILARDRFGVKPLHYMIHNGVLYFSSEIKPLIKIKGKLTFNDTIIKSFFIDTATDYNEQTFSREVYQVKPGCIIKIEKDKTVRESKWYEGNDFAFSKEIFADKQKTITFFENLLVDAIEIRHRSDAPVCITLSGGLDSTVIYVLTKERIKSSLQPFIYSSSDSETDESIKALRLATEYGDKPIVVKSNPSNNIETLVESLKFLEFPTWDPSAIAYIDTYKAIKNKGFKVVIEGHGSDEQLGGYPYMVGAAWKELLLKGSLKFAYKIYNVFLSTMDYTSEQTGNGKNKNLRNILSMFISLVRGLLDVVVRPSNIKYLNMQSLIEDSFNYKILPIVLRTFDRLSMSQSIESRCPFMDFRIVEFLKSLPLKYKVNEIGSKAILREILKKYNKDYIYLNKLKTGFGLDSQVFFNNPLNIKYFEKEVRDFNYPEFNYIRKIAMDNIKDGTTLINYQNIWKVGSLEMIKKIYE